MAKQKRVIPFDKKYCDMIVDWFRVGPQTTEIKRTYHKSGELKSEEPVIMAAPFPTFCGFTDSIGVCRSNLERWRRRHGCFDRAYERAKQLQENILLVNCISGLYSPAFGQFYLKNLMEEGERREERRDDGLPISEEEAKRALEALGYKGP